MRKGNFKRWIAGASIIAMLVSNLGSDMSAMSIVHATELNDPTVEASADPAVQEEPAAAEPAVTEEAAAETQDVDTVDTVQDTDTVTDTDISGTAASVATSAASSDTASTADAASTETSAAASDAASTAQTTQSQAGNITVSYTAGEGGTVSLPDEKVDLTSETVTYQGSTATAADGYKFMNWTDESEQIVSQDATFVPSNLTTDKAFVANFEKDEVTGQKMVTVTYTASEGGTVSLDQETVDLAGQDASFKGSTATAKDGYEFVSWNDADGNAVSKDATFVPEIKAKDDGTYSDGSYTAEFQKKKVTVSYEISPKGSATVLGDEEVTIGDDLSFTVKPGSKYTIGSVNAADKELATISDAESKNKEYRLENVTEDVTVNIVMETTVLHPAFHEEETINGVTITLDAVEGVLPAGINMQVKEVTTDVFKPKQRRSPLATLYSPPPSQARKERAVLILPSPGSRRSIISPSEISSKVHSSLGLKLRFIISPPYMILFKIKIIYCVVI